MSWSTMPNGADRSRRMRRDGEPASDDINRLFVTLKNALCTVGCAESELEFFIEVIEF